MKQPRRNLCLAQISPSSTNNFYLQTSRYPILRDNGLRFISLFGTTYKCEQFFSRIKATKTAHRTRLTDIHLEQTLKVCVSTVRPDINGVQAQHSH
ncbi:GTF2IRD2B (predicted) [Pycnogonum litorale]